MVDASCHLGGHSFDPLALDFDLCPGNGCVVGGAVEIDDQVLASKYADEFEFEERCEWYARLGFAEDEDVPVEDDTPEPLDESSSQPEGRKPLWRQALGRVAYTDFFGMFEPPFRFGSPWGASEDASHARVIVLGKEINEKLFGGQDSVGKSVRLDGNDYRVVGVLGDWNLRFRYYDVTNGAFADPDEFFIPFTTAIDLKQRASGNNSCFSPSGDGWDAYLDSDCVWIQMWVQLDSAHGLEEYKSFLDNYVNEQKKLGRFQRPLNNRLLDVNGWMKDQEVVSRDMEVQTGLAFAFLIVCLVNTAGLLLAKFLRRSSEIGVRRALGAPRAAIYAQFLTEGGMIGLAGGVLGLVLTGIGVAVMLAILAIFKYSGLIVAPLLPTGSPASCRCCSRRCRSWTSSPRARPTPTWSGTWRRPPTRTPPARRNPAAGVRGSRCRPRACRRIRTCSVDHARIASTR